MRAGEVLASARDRMELSRMSLRSCGLRDCHCSPHERSDMREACSTHHALVMLQIVRDAFISSALSLEPGRFA